MKKGLFIGRPEMLSQDKQRKPQEYFVYFKVWVVQDCGRRSAVRGQDFFILTPKTKLDRFGKRSNSNNNTNRNSIDITASIALHEVVTVRQMFSDGPGKKAQAAFSLRRYFLSHPAAAWPCR